MKLSPKELFEAFIEDMEIQATCEKCGDPSFETLLQKPCSCEDFKSDVKL